ncbi:MAG: hypothetical protein AAFY59_15860 [Pseudomonadota bacterium]
MTDPLDDLKKALKATPAPRAEARDAALRAAMEGFAAEAQEPAAEPRPMPERPHPVAALWKGLGTMLSKTLTRPALMGTASLATIALAVAITSDYRPSFLTPQTVDTEFQAAEITPEAQAIEPVIRIEPGQTMEDLGFSEERGAPVEEAEIVPPVIIRPEGERDDALLPPALWSEPLASEESPVSDQANGLTSLERQDLRNSLQQLAPPPVAQPQEQSAARREGEPKRSEAAANVAHGLSEATVAEPQQATPETAPDGPGPTSLSGAAERGVTFGDRAEPDFAGDVADFDVFVSGEFGTITLGDIDSEHDAVPRSAPSIPLAFS